MSSNKHPRRGRFHGPVNIPPSSPLHRRSTSRPRTPSKRVLFADPPTDQGLSKTSDVASKSKAKGKDKRLREEGDVNRSTRHNSLKHHDCPI